MSRQGSFDEAPGWGTTFVLEKVENDGYESANHARRKAKLLKSIHQRAQSSGSAGSSPKQTTDRTQQPPTTAGLSLR